MNGKAVAWVLTGAQLLWASGCMSVHATGSRPAEGSGGGVAVQVFADDAARRAGRPGPAGVLGELERQQGKEWVPVFRSLDPAWAAAGLPPGRYRLRFPARLDDAGNVVRLDERGKVIDVKRGAITEVQTTLEHMPAALVVVGVVTVVVAAVLLADWLQDHDLPLPPPPPPELLDAVFYVSIDLASAASWSGVSDQSPPAVTSHFPADGAVVAARRPRVVLSLSEPLNPTELEAGGVTVLGEASGLVPGQVSCDAERWWVVWQPQADLRAGDSFHVTMAADAVEDQAGNELTAPVSFAFSTAD